MGSDNSSKQICRKKTRPVHFADASALDRHCLLKMTVLYAATGWQFSISRAVAVQM